MTKPFGLLAEYESSDKLVEVARALREKGYSKMEAYSPYPIEEISEALGQKKSKLLLFVFLGGCVGFLTGFGLQYWISAVDYPYIVGGRPFNSWVSFIPIIFELTVLFSAFTATFGMLAVNGFPRPHHPVFNSERFREMTTDKFFISIEADDEKFDHEKTKNDLESLGALGVEDIDDE